MLYTYANHHNRNPYYRPDPPDLCERDMDYVSIHFANAIVESYVKLNMRRNTDGGWWVEKMRALVTDAMEAEANYEKQLVRLSQPAIPSRGPHGIKTRCQVFEGERPVEITAAGKIQFLLSTIEACIPPSTRAK